MKELSTHYRNSQHFYNLSHKSTSEFCSYEAQTQIAIAIALHGLRLPLNWIFDHGILDPDKYVRVYDFYVVQFFLKYVRIIPCSHTISPVIFDLGAVSALWCRKGDASYCT